MPIYKLNGKRDGLQRYRVTVCYTEAGKYKQTTRTVYGLAEAKQTEAELLARVGTPASSRMTVGSLAERFLAVKQPDVREITYNSMERVLRLHILPCLGSIPLDRLTVADLEDWKLYVNRTELKLSSKKEIFRVLRGLFGYAERSGLISPNPAKLVTNFRDASENVPGSETLHYYTAPQFVSFADELKKDAERTGDWRFFVFFAIAFFTGMRKGEINALRWNAVEGDVIHVRRAVVQNINGRTVENPPKTPSSYRDLQMPAPLKAVLAAQLERQRSSSAFSTEDYVVGGKAVIPDRSITDKKDRAADAAGLPRITVHDFRHSHASLLINEGISIQEIARRLGHADVQTTWKVYAHLYPREEERAVRVLNAVTI